MSDLRTYLDREAARIAPRVDALARVLDRVERRDRRRRLSAGIVALVIAAAGLAGPYFLFAGGARSRPSADRGPWRGLWPQVSWAEAESAQEAADSNDPAFSWQVDAKSTIERFARDQLGWSEVRFESLSNTEELAPDIGWVDDPADLADASQVGPLRFLISACREPEPGTLCEAAYVTIERLLRRDETGIWSVTHVEGASLGFPERTPSD